MITSLTIDVPGIPVAKRHPQKMTQPIKEQTEKIQRMFARYNTKWEGPVAADITFIFEPSRSMPECERIRACGSAKITKPSTDDLVRLVTDALRGIAFEECCNVSCITARKIYGAKAKTVIHLREIPAGELL